MSIHSGTMNLLLGALLTCKAFAVARQGMAESSLHAQDAILDGYKDMPEHAALKLGPASIAEVDHTTVAHSAFPKHSVRITRVRDFCDTTIKYDPVLLFGRTPYIYLTTLTGRTQAMSTSRPGTSFSTFSRAGANLRPTM